MNKLIETIDGSYMKRPQVDDYRVIKGSNYITVNEYVSYARDLDKYCDELERMNHSVVKALDKALEIMTSGLECSGCETCYASEHHFKCADKNGWRRYLLKDE